MAVLYGNRAMCYFKRAYYESKDEWEQCEADCVAAIEREPGRSVRLHSLSHRSSSGNFYCAPQEL